MWQCPETLNGCITLFFEVVCCTKQSSLHEIELTLQVHFVMTQNLHEMVWGDLQ